MEEVEAGFCRLLDDRIWSTKAERDAWKSHSASLEAKLAARFGVASFFRTGSTGNGTNVRNYSDSDYFAVIPEPEHRRDSDGMLRVLRAALVERYPQTEIYIRNPVVVVNFGATAAERYEIAPAYFVERKDGLDVYKVPAGNGEWMRSSPKIHNRYVNDMNKKLDEKLKPVIRFVKAIAYWNSIPLRSFYLELRLTKFLQNENAIVYSIDVANSLKHLIDVELASMQDPMGVSGYVSACSSGEKADAVSKLQTAYNRASKARSAEIADDFDAAFDWWDKVFAGRFPVYV